MLSKIKTFKGCAPLQARQFYNSITSPVCLTGSQPVFRFSTIKDKSPSKLLFDEQNKATLFEHFNGEVNSHFIALTSIFIVRIISNGSSEAISFSPF